MPYTSTVSAVGFGDVSRPLTTTAPGWAYHRAFAGSRVATTPTGKFGVPSASPASLAVTPAAASSIESPRLPTMRLARIVVPVPAALTPARPLNAMTLHGPVSHSVVPVPGVSALPNPRTVP